MESWRSSKYSRRLPQPQKKSKSRVLLGLVLFVLITAISIYILFSSSLLKVSDIKIEGVADNQAAQVYNALIDNINDKFIFNVEEGYVRNVFHEKFPGLKLDKVEYNFPNTLSLGASEREGKYNIQAANGNFSADEEGYVLGTSTPSAAFNFDVIYDKSLEVGQKIEDASLRAALIYSGINKNVKIENDQIVMELNDGGRIILPKNDAVTKVNEVYTLLQKITQKYTIENRQVEFIDLRFSKPVIKYKE